MWPSAGANGHDGRGGEHSGGGRDLSGDLARGAPGSQPPPNGRGSYSMLLGQQAERGVSGLGGFLHGQQFAGYASHQQPQLDYGPGRPAFSYSGLSLQSQPPPSLYLGQLQHPLGSLYRPPSAATSGLGPDALSSLSGNSAQPSPFAQNSNRGPESESNFLLSKDAADYFNASMALNNYRMSLAQLGGPIAAGHAQPGSAAFPPPLNPGLPPNASMMAHQYPPPHPGDPSNPIPSLPPFRFENDYGQPAQNPRQQQQQQPEMREAAEQQEADSKDSPEEAPVSSPSEDPEDSGSEEYRPRGGRRRGRLPKRSFAGSGRPKADPSPGGGKAKTHVCDVCGMAFGSSGVNI